MLSSYAGCGVGPGNRAVPKRSGFTLIELMVVIAIIGLLLIFLIIGVQGVQMRSKIHNTEAFIQSLEQGCVAYRENFGAGREYPPMDKGSGQNPLTGDSSKNLIYYLGRKLSKSSGGTAVAGIQLPPAEEQKPIMTFGEEMIEQGCLVDAWQRRILYYRHTGSGGDPFSGGSFPGHDTVFKDSQTLHVDVVSYGPFETGKDGDDPGGQDCKIATWKKQWK